MTPDPRRVAVVHDATLAYPLTPPFDPPNPIYAAVVALFERLGLDQAHRGTPEWNPLGDLVRPGQRIVIKPNLVSSRNYHERYTQDDFLCCCTHPSVIRPVIDFAWRALGGDGAIAVCEAPLEGGQFHDTVAALGVTPMLEALRARGLPVDLIDLRDFRIVPRMALDNLGVAGRSVNVGLLQRLPLPGDPRGYTTVDLGDASSFAAWNGRCERLRFHHSNPDFPSRQHQGGHHRYSLPNSLLAADLLISLPKMKSHKKTGVTLSLKNMIGTTNQKYWLPHYSAGAPPLGDEYPVTPPLAARVEHFLSRVTVPGGHAVVLRFPVAGQREDPVIYDGNWSGNDTLWRTILDLNRIVQYAGADGTMRPTPQRRMLSLIDGVIAGEGNGPLAPRAKRCGLLLAGLDSWACDWIATRMMGVEPTAIGFLADAVRAGAYPVTRLTPGEIEVVPPELATHRDDFLLPLGWRDVRAGVAAG